MLEEFDLQSQPGDRMFARQGEQLPLTASCDARRFILLEEMVGRA